MRRRHTARAQSSEGTYSGDASARRNAEDKARGGTAHDPQPTPRASPAEQVASGGVKQEPRPRFSSVRFVSAIADLIVAALIRKPAP